MSHVCERPHVTIQHQLKDFFLNKICYLEDMEEGYVMFQLKFCWNRATLADNLLGNLKRLSTSVSTAIRWLFIEAQNISNKMCEESQHILPPVRYVLSREFSQQCLANRHVLAQYELV
jgi:hypothetical protein